jgi:hypothetical protein
MAESSAPVSPYDTTLSATSRFLVELLAWISGPWAAVELTGSALAVLPAAIVLVGAPAVFSTPGDKRQVLVATPGPLRLTLELVLVAVGIASAWLVWPAWAGVLATLLGAVMLIANARRFRWLAAGAPAVQ